MPVETNSERTFEVIAQFWLTIPSLWHALRAVFYTDIQENLGISAEQYHSLRCIARGLDSVSELARVKGFSRSAISRAVDALVNRELVERSQDPQDRRRVQLILTPHGQTMLDVVTDRMDEWLRGKFETLDDGELELIGQAFSTLNKAFG